MGRKIKGIELIHDYTAEVETYNNEGNVFVYFRVFKPSNNSKFILDLTLSAIVNEPNFIESLIIKNRWEDKIDRKIKKFNKKAKAWVLRNVKAENAVSKSAYLRD